MNFGRLSGSFLFTTALLCLWLAAAAAAPAPARTVKDLDRILAVVNDDVITESELTTRLEQTKRRLALEKIALPADNVLRQQLLERMVVERLQLQLSERTGVRVPEADVDRALETVAQSNKMSLADFRRMLVREGLDPQAHAAEIRAQLTIRQLLDREINNRVNVSESEIASFLEAHPSGTDIEYNLSHIFLPLPESASPETIQAARKRADDILRQLKEGASFEKLAVTHSQGESALTGGSLGWKKAGQLPELFLPGIKNLAPGSVSEVLRGPNGFHVLRLNNKRGDTAAASVTQVHVRHILLRHSEIQSPEEARAKLLNLRNRIEHGEDFTVLAKAHSDDAGSAASGGDLGWSNPGQFVPEFEKAMNALKPGELSQPGKSPFGLHLIQVVARRAQDISEERLQASARQQNHPRNAGESYRQWLIQTR